MEYSKYIPSVNCRIISHPHKEWSSSLVPAVVSEKNALPDRGHNSLRPRVGRPNAPLACAFFFTTSCLRPFHRNGLRPPGVATIPFLFACVSANGNSPTRCRRGTSELLVLPASVAGDRRNLHLLCFGSASLDFLQEHRLRQNHVSV